MKLKNYLISGVVSLGLLAGGVAVAQNASGFDQKQQADIEKIVHDYLLKNPQILVDMSQALQETEQKKMLQQGQAAIEKNAKTMFDQHSPKLGNLNGDVTLVEFFDYQCSHCQESAPIVASLIEKNKNLRVVFKEFPIFGKGSEFAAKAALASVKQGKYEAFHNALMAANQPLSESSVLKIASSVGINTDQLKKDMDSSEVNDEIKANVKLAEAMHLMATPIFIVIETPKGSYKTGSKTFFIPGAVGEENLQNYINQAKGA